MTIPRISVLAEEMRSSVAVFINVFDVDQSVSVVNTIQLTWFYV
jgi:hypothetical protein